MLEVNGLIAGYGKVQVLHGISLRVPEGALVTLIGSNGAGKTTTLRTISGLMHPTGGKIVFDGAPAARAGIRPEDLILDIDGSPIRTAGDLQRVMVDEVIGRSVAVKIYRNGTMLTLTATPAKLQV